ncbi:MAG: nucleotidyltransferase domain-containing protein, partial [Bacteroidota bacterium]
MIGSKISLTEDQIRDFCLRWKIKEFALFGSVLREDFNPQSDIDV